MDINGILLLDKEVGMTSFEAVRKIKQLLNVKKAGHAGTLDKAASGLLILCLGKATGVQNLLMSAFKRYRATGLLGFETDTLDKYGKVIKSESIGLISPENIQNILKKFVGKMLQVPPYYSALHKNGKRLYRRALDGERVEIEPREIEIKELCLLGVKKDSFTFEVLASKGTYIRALGRDIAHALGTCGYLADLRRLEIGRFSVENAVKLHEIDKSTRIISVQEALSDIPQITVDADKLTRIRDGVPPVKVLSDKQWQALNPGYYRIKYEDMLLAIIEKNKTLRYFKVFNDPL
jgi:tRNA pseudouridine55 synthase